METDYKSNINQSTSCVRINGKKTKSIFGKFIPKNGQVSIVLNMFEKKVFFYLGEDTIPIFFFFSKTECLIF